ncbi:MAG: sigma-70 family RNA polymerase sigma factor [Terriglobia bacterium]|jgi:RNA polymerase sigma-70 factor (ECF subfamily)
MMPSDEELWQKVRKGDADAFADFYRAYAPPLRRFLHWYIGDFQAEEDVTQEIFLHLWRGPNGFNPSRAPLKRYLFGMARKRAADWWRRHPSTMASSVLESQMPAAEAGALLENALAHLDPESRTLVWLRQAEGYTYVELAEIFQIPLGTVRSRLFTARERLRQVWAGDGGSGNKGAP